MKMRVFYCIFAILVMSFLCACAPAFVPLHMPADMSNFSDYSNIASKEISKLDPFSDGTPKYVIRIKTGSHRTPGGSMVVDDYIYARTNADTQGLELLSDGSSKYSVSVGYFKNETGSGYLVKVVDSAKSRQKRIEENRLKDQEIAEAIRQKYRDEAISQKYRDQTKTLEDGQAARPEPQPSYNQSSSRETYGACVEKCQSAKNIRDMLCDKTDQRSDFYKQCAYNSRNYYDSCKRPCEGLSY